MRLLGSARPVRRSATFGTSAFSVPSIRGSRFIRSSASPSLQSSRDRAARRVSAASSSLRVFGPLQRQNRESTRHGPLPDPLCSALGLFEAPRRFVPRDPLRGCGPAGTRGVPPLQGFSLSGSRSASPRSVPSCRSNLTCRSATPRLCSPGRVRRPSASTRLGMARCPPGVCLSPPGFFVSPP